MGKSLNWKQAEMDWHQQTKRLAVWADKLVRDINIFVLARIKRPRWREDNTQAL